MEWCATATRPGDQNFDVRCYQESFMPIVLRLPRNSTVRDLPQKEVYRVVDSEIQIEKLPLPASPAAGYRMLRANFRLLPLQRIPWAWK